MEAERKIIITVLDVEAETDYSGCYYEGDTPSIKLTSTLRNLSVKELLDDMNEYELRALGLKRIGKQKKAKE